MTILRYITLGEFILTGVALVLLAHRYELVRWPAALLVLWTLNGILFQSAVILGNFIPCQLEPVTLNFWSTLVRAHGLMTILGISVAFLFDRHDDN